ncbi:alpha/beta hydrolase fold domain-containing protein [Mariniblastus sp.]|nr:alpha/beta hydrolase fold domain-containing protein [Mariniblastus sp.]
MKYHILMSLALLLSLSANAVFAQETEADRESLIRANRAMKKLDTDGNGSFEKSESKNEKVWRRFAKLDTNKDDVISLEEFRRQPKAKTVYLETGGERKLDVVYKTIGKRKLKLDLYYPTNQSTEAVPVVIYTHGGGWAAGSKQGAAKSSFAAVFKRLLDQGFAVASVEYRLVRKGGDTQMRDCVIDSKDAVRYLAKNSEDLKLNSNRFYTMGDSAGGQIAQMLLLGSTESLSGDEELASVPYKMVAGVSWYGPCDFEKTSLFNHDDREKFKDRFGARILKGEVTAEQKLKLYREMSPINYLSAESPPLLMIQGDKDTTIPVKHAYYMAEKAKSVKAPVQTMIIKNSGHNWRKVDADIDPSRDEIIDRTVEFFVKHK